MKASLDIDRRLALAIGWRPEQMRVIHGSLHIYYDPANQYDWRLFRHKDPAVIWPIAERYDCFPAYDPVKKDWAAYTQESKRMSYDINPATVVALAVIGGKT